MKLLLDTHVLIWSAGNPEKLSDLVTSLLNDTSNSWVISIASIWEIQIKIQKTYIHSNLIFTILTALVTALVAVASL